MVGVEVVGVDDDDGADDDDDDDDDDVDSNGVRGGFSTGIGRHPVAIN